ncbi:lysine-specific demethylase JMJ31-like isoform X1 [Prosopis cineraria]|uniref:lysine-specific demethylase JMJ31-like isoform X1 n=1 Tax=Prosopis cineraria TaxID=364024 RepID=UPI002410A4B4|nr:lysine-specific demethylase JMJ31-like isoform X1 [Prosopis cineraria]
MSVGESIRIQRFEELPAATDFESLVEARNVPAVFSGCIKGWRAFSKWNPSNGGLDYLQERVGSFMVEAMLSRSAPIFYGDIGSHERVPLLFSTFIGFCKKHMQNKDGGLDACFGPQRHDPAGSNTEHGSLQLEHVPEQIYLAQVAIMNNDHEDRVQLETLREDVRIPPILEAKELSSINLWMNNAQARSSTHYDPHHNLLCIVSGRKQVLLWPPSASPLLYPMPIYGEASNHSSVALESPDYSLYPRAKNSMKFAQKAVLNAGDALFIPEGWFHQVDSDDLTIAVNIWWRSKLISCMLEHMDTYFLRRILRRLIDKEMDQLLDKSGMGETRVHACKQPNDGETDHDDDNDILMSKGKGFEGENILLELEPTATQVLHELVSLVHNNVSVTDQEQRLLSTSANDSELGASDEFQKLETANLKDDPVAKILWDVEPLTLRNVFLAMAQNFPRTLEALVLHVLSPVGAEVLTRKFDEMDQKTLAEDRNRFYEAFYSAFDDQSMAMNSILKGKESFAQQAFKNVLEKHVGVNPESSKRGVR